MDQVFARLKSEFGGRVSFISLDWESARAEPIRSQFSMRKPPSSVIADADGQVREKFESRLSIEDMRAKLRRAESEP